MRVLMLHNRYRAPGGEERVVTAQTELLRRHGHEVETLERDSSELGAAAAARGLLSGGIDPTAVADTVRHFAPDVVHGHNLHPSLGWRALAAARAGGARTVLQLHNFRLYCAIGIAYRDRRPCHDCVGRDTLPGVAHRCRGGLPESVIYGAGLALQQQRLLDGADQLIALSHGHLALLERHGLPAGRAAVVPNFIADGGWAEDSAADRGGYALVAGRLVEEKGFDTALRAALSARVPLVIAGRGPDEDRLRGLVRGGDVSFRGWVDPDELTALVRGAAAVLVPSRCEEAFGYGALDALAAGVPVIASDRGGLPELVASGGGAVLDPDDVRGWEFELARLWADPAARLATGRRGLAGARERYGEAQALAGLLSAYGASA